MLNEYATGGGSMAVEAEKTAQSLEGSLNRLSNTWTDLVENFANSDGMTVAVNGLNGLLSVLNKITENPMVASGTVGGILGLILNANGMGYVIYIQFSTIVYKAHENCYCIG